MKSRKDRGAPGQLKGRSGNRDPVCAGWDYTPLKTQVHSFTVLLVSSPTLDVQAAAMARSAFVQLKPVVSAVPILENLCHSDRETEGTLLQGAESGPSCTMEEAIEAQTVTLEKTLEGQTFRKGGG